MAKLIELIGGWANEEFYFADSQEKIQKLFNAENKRHLVNTDSIYYLGPDNVNGVSCTRIVFKPSYNREFDTTYYYKNSYEEVAANLLGL